MSTAPQRDHRDQWFQQLVATVGGDLLRFLRSRLSHGDQAQDLAQEVYLRLLRVEDIGLIRNPRAFVIHLAAHAAHEWRMLARNRLQHSQDELQELAADDGDPADAIERDSQIHQLERVLSKLTPKQQAVLLMHRRDGMTYQEIASHMQLSVAMVKKHLSRGLAVCHQHMCRTAEGE